MTPRNDPRFRVGQKVVVENMLINGERRDTWGIVQGFGRGLINKDNVEVVINGVILYFNEDRLVDFEEYWRNKRNESKSD